MPWHKSTRRPGASLLRDVSHPFPGPGTAAVILVGAVQGESCAAAGIQHGGCESQRRRQVTAPPPRRRTNNSTIGQAAVTVRSSARAALLQTAVLQICKILPSSLQSEEDSDICGKNRNIIFAPVRR